MNEFGDKYIRKACQYLNTKTKKCRLWDTDDFPPVCKNFPALSDSVYRHVADVCTFKFILEKEKND